MKELFIVCIDHGYEGWTLDVFDNEDEATERTKESYGSSFRVFKGVELGLSFKDKLGCNLGGSVTDEVKSG